MKKISAIIALLVATVAFAAGPYVFKNSALNEDIKFLINHAGDMVEALRINGENNRVEVNALTAIGGGPVAFPDGIVGGGAGGGGAGKNYVAGTSSTTGWLGSTSGAVTVSNVDANLPAEFTTGTGIKFSGGSVGGYAYYCFTIDEADKYRAMDLSWYQRPVSGYAYNHLAVEVYSHTGAACTGTAARVPITSDAGSSTPLDNVTGHVNAYFNVSSITTYSLRVKRSISSSTEMVLSDIVVGPNSKLSQKAAREYVTNGSALYDLSGWYKDSNAFLVRYGNDSRNPRPSVGTYLLVTSGSSAYAYHNMIIDPIDVGKIFKFSYSVSSTSSGAAGALIQQNTANDCSGSWSTVLTTSVSPGEVRDVESTLLVTGIRCYRIALAGNPVGGTAANSLSFQPIQKTETAGGYSDFYFNDFEAGVVYPFVTYDSGTEAPGTGSGGTANYLTLSNVKSNPLNGEKSLLLTKSSNNARGNGAALPFTVPLGYRNGAKYALEFLWNPSVNYVSGAVKVYIYDVTNGSLITPEGNSLPAAKTKISLAWDASTASSYRLLFHVAGDQTANWFNYIDDLRIWPGEVIPMPASGYLGSLSMTVSNSGLKVFTVGNRCWRKDNVLTCKFTLDGDATASGGSDVTAFTLNLPSDLSIDASALPYPSNMNDPRNNVGYHTTFGILTASAYAPQAEIRPLSPNRFVFLKGDSSTGSTAPVRTVDLDVARDMDIMGEFSVPIAEWADSPNYAASAKQAVVSTKVRNSSNQVFNMTAGGTQKINNDNIIWNVGGGVWSNGVFTVPATGKYGVTANFITTTGNVLAQNYGIYVYVNSGAVEIFRKIPTAATPIDIRGETNLDLKAGDNVEFRVYSQANHSTNTLTQDWYALTGFTIDRLTDEYGRPVVGFGYATPQSSGLVSTGGQTFGGDKTFEGNVTAATLTSLGSIISNGRMANANTHVSESLSNNATASVVTAPPILSAWLITAFSTTSGTSHHVLALATKDNSGAGYVNTIISSGISVSFSGGNFIITNTSGSTRQIRATALRLY